MGVAVLVAGLISPSPVELLTGLLATVVVAFAATTLLEPMFGFGRVVSKLMMFVAAVVLPLGILALEVVDVVAVAVVDVVVLVVVDVVSVVVVSIQMGSVWLKRG